MAVSLVTLPSGTQVNIWERNLTAPDGEIMTKTGNVGDNENWQIVRGGNWSGPFPVDDPIPGTLDGRWNLCRGRGLNAWLGTVPDDKNMFPDYRAQFRSNGIDAMGPFSRPDLHPDTSRSNAHGAGDNLWRAWEYYVVRDSWVATIDPDDADWSYGGCGSSAYLGDTQNGSTSAAQGFFAINTKQNRTDPTKIDIQCTVRRNDRYNFEGEDTDVRSGSVKTLETNQHYSIICETQMATFTTNNQTGDTVSWNNDGFVRVWVDGVLELEWTNLAWGIANRSGCHWKIGFYPATYKNQRWGWGTYGKCPGTNPPDNNGWCADALREIYVRNMIMVKDQEIQYARDILTLPDSGGEPVVVTQTPTLAGNETDDEGNSLNDGSATISLSCATPDSTIYYTTNGSTPTTAGEVFSTPVTVTNTTRFRAFATSLTLPDSGYLDETVVIVKPSQLPAGKVNSGDTVSYGDFTADDGYSEGGSDQYLSRAITNTTDAPDEVFYSRAVFSIGEDRTTFFQLTPGVTYKVFLYWCEQFHEVAGQRLVTVTASGEPVAAEIDLFAGLNVANKVQAGSFIATGEDSVTVTSNGPDKGAVNAIEVVANYALPIPSYINYGGGTQQIPNWTSDLGFTTGGSDGYSERPIDNTLNDAVFWSRKVINNDGIDEVVTKFICTTPGTYNIFFMFAEQFYEDSGNRLIDIDILTESSNQNIVDYDFFEDVDAKDTALLKQADTFVLQVDDEVTIKCRASAGSPDNATLCGIIFERSQPTVPLPESTTTPPQHRVYVRGQSTMDLYDENDVFIERVVFSPGVTYITFDSRDDRYIISSGQPLVSFTGMYESGA